MYICIQNEKWINEACFCEVFYLVYLQANTKISYYKLIIK